MDELLKFLNIKGVKDYDDLTRDEQETYREMLNVQAASAVTLEEVKRHVHKMRESIEYELAKLPEKDPRNVLYKARLLNYLLLEALFDRPERAKEMLKSYQTKGKL